MSRPSTRNKGLTTGQLSGNILIGGSMNAGYKARREAKHAAQKANRLMGVSVSAGTIDLTVKHPTLSFIGARQFRQSGQQRKGRSGHLPEHTAALVENASHTPGDRTQEQQR